MAEPASDYVLEDYSASEAGTGLDQNQMWRLGSTSYPK
jgi:hypothetical protein